MSDINNTRSEMVLSERQKMILEEQGLTTEYGNLSAKQQQAIVSVENALNYVEKKYDMSFCYSGYVEAGWEKETVYAYPTDGFKDIDTFSIIVTDNGYDDDYLNVSLGAPFSEYIAGLVSAKSGCNDIRVFSEITMCSMEWPLAEQIFDGNIEAGVWVFTDGAVLTNGEAISKAVEAVMNEHNLYGIVQVIVLNEGNFKVLTRHNYTDFLNSEYYSYRDTLYVRK